MPAIPDPFESVGLDVPRGTSEDSKVVLPSKACLCCVSMLQSALSEIVEGFDLLQLADPDSQIALVPGVPVVPEIGAPKVVTPKRVLRPRIIRIPKGTGGALGLGSVVLWGGQTIADLATTLGSTQALAQALELVSTVIGAITAQALDEDGSCADCMKRRSLPQKPDRRKTVHDENGRHRVRI